jgi:GT2 family glycosyltransferase/glycosyltransferase involved in cell wall biosynthesis
MDRGIFNSIFAFGYEDIELGWRLAQFGLRVIYEPAAVSTMIRTLTFRDFCARQQRQGRSQRIFAGMHTSPEIRKYCEIDAGLVLWKRNAGRFTQYMRWVERLDHMAAVYAQANLPMDQRVQSTLDDAYRAVFMLCRAKGLAWDAGEDIASAQTSYDGRDANSRDNPGSELLADPAPLEFEQAASADVVVAVTLDRERTKCGGAKSPKDEVSATKAIAALLPPKATIVVCTYNRYQYLAALLAKLERQKADFTYEILIVDNSDDETAKANFYGAMQFTHMARVVPSFPPGLSRARNVGLQAAKGEYVAFVDDDTEPGPDWLRGNIDIFEKHDDAAVVGGPIFPIWPIERPEWVPRKYEDALAIINLGNEKRELKYEYLYGANICFRVDALRSIGGFREHLGRQGAVGLLGNEELQVQDELRKKGHSIWYAPKGGLSHHVHQGRIDRGWFRRRMTWQAVSDALTMDGLSDMKQGLDFVISAADRIGIDRSFLNCLVDSNDPENMQAQLEFLRGLVTLALSTKASMSADELTQLTQSAKVGRNAERSVQSPTTGRYGNERLGTASNLQRGSVVFFEATPGHEFLFNTFSELKDASLFTQRLDPWAEDEDGIKKLFDFLDLGLRKASECSSAIFFLTVDYWERPYLPIGEVIARRFKQRVSDSGIAAFAFLHRYPTDPGGIARLQHIAPVLKKLLVFSPDMKLDLKRNLGLKNVGYVPLPAMIENFPAGDRAAIRARLSIPDDRVVVSMLGEARQGKGYDVMLAALAQLDSATKRKALFLFGGKASPELKKTVVNCLNDNGLLGLADLRDASDKRQFNVLSDSEFSDYIQASDIGLLIYREDQRFAMSGVLPNYVVAGKPVIATADSYAGKLISKHGLGWLLSKESPAELAELIAEAVRSADSTRLSAAVAKYKPEMEKRAVLARLKKILEC